MVVANNLNYSEVGKKLGVSKNRISIWCQGLAGTRWASLIKKNQQKRNITLNSEIGILRKFDIDNNRAKLCAGIMYGCEGSKYPSSNGVAFTNSDSNLVAAFISLMRKAFRLDETKWRVHLLIHSNQNYSQMVSYWSRLLKVQKSQFIKPTITVPLGKKHRNEYKGTCSLRYNSCVLQLKLIGIFEAFMRKSMSLEGGQNGYAQVR